MDKQGDSYGNLNETFRPSFKELRPFEDYLAVPTHLN